MKGELTMTVYVIMKGEYSEIHVVTVTLDKEKAEKLAQFHSSYDSEAWVEEFEADRTPDAILDTKVPVYYVVIQKDGTSTVSIAHYHYGDKPHEPRFFLSDDRNMIFTAYLTAPDESHALKIARDRRAKMIAEQMGL